MEIKEKVQQYTPALLADLAELVSYPSVLSDDAAPFGQANIDCLNAALRLGEREGFKAVNVDNYVGYIEMGEGDQVIGIVGHLDVIPVTDSWKTDPFKLTKIDDKYFGRGTSDDKGGVICGLYAMKILSELQPKLNKRVRLIMGCNEENGSACLRHYVAKEGVVDCGFTPDGSFPLVFGEKGMIFGTLTGKSEKIVNVAGGTAHNVVCPKIVFTFAEDCFDEKILTEYLQQHDLKFTYENHVLTVYGVAAHASTPEEGLNAMSHAFEALYKAGINDSFVDLYHEKVGTGYYGEKLGIDLNDEYGRLTFNMGVIEEKDGVIRASIDIRFPVTMRHGPIMETMIANGEGHVVDLEGEDPLFFPLDHPMIGAMLQAYYDVTGSDEKPITMGGGTYARDMANIVAFGCDTHEYNWHIHDDNEFVTLKSLQLQTEIYTKALINLLKI
ncbi:MAG: Sapep family Mn(2+)-dependent dipeptidase [Erysipelotrichaceae bacterium]|nr:Sapep family Mn(2+)-dependent dipeptidase [Erysipelotrichaceae bacterium]